MGLARELFRETSHAPQSQKFSPRAARAEGTGAFAPAKHARTGQKKRSRYRFSRRTCSGEAFFGFFSRTASEPPHEPIPFLKPRLKARSTQPSERGTDMMVADATSEKGGIASSGGRRFAPSRRRRCRCAHFHHAMWRHLVRYSSARVRCAYPCPTHATHAATPPS